MSEHTKRERAEAPEPAPPAFHRPAKRKPAKPWAVRWRVTRGAFARICGEWGTLRRYRTREDAERGLAAYVRGERGRFSNAGYLPSASECRLVGPDGES